MPRKRITEATILRDRWTRTKRQCAKYRSENANLRRQVKRLQAWRAIAIQCGGFKLRKGTR